MKIFKRLFCLVSLLALISSLSSCTSFDSTKEESAVVLKCAGYDVTYEMWRYAVLKTLDDKVNAHGYEITEEFISSRKGEELNLEVLSDAQEVIKSLYGVFSLAKEYGIDHESEVIKNATDLSLKEQKSKFSSDKEYKNALSDEHMTLSVSRTLAAFDVVYTELYDAMIASGDIESDSSKLRDIFDSSEFIRVKELFISYERHSHDEAEAIANRVLGELRGGADFDETVKKNGESLFMFGNTDGYYICRGIWDSELEDTAFSLSIGEISDVVRCKDGFRILQRLEKQTSYIEKKEKSLTETYTEGIFRRKIEEAVATSSFELNEVGMGYTAFSMREVNK